VVETHSRTSQKTALSGRVRQVFPRHSSEVVSAMGEYPTSIVSDCMNRMGVMDGIVSPVVRGRPFCGPALTVEEVEGGNLMSHIALDLAQAGDAIVIDAKGITSRAAWGGVQTLMAEKREVGGIVINGALRDYEDIRNGKMPIYAIGTSPGGPHKGWSGNVNHSISCAGVTVNAGDLVVADDDGVVVVPFDLVEEILPLCAERKKIEDEWISRVRNGEATLDVVGLRSKLGSFGIDFS
jgi:regulator of RNase E activity RraA